VVGGYQTKECRFKNWDVGYEMCSFMHSNWFVSLSPLVSMMQALVALPAITVGL